MRVRFPSSAPLSRTGGVPQIIAMRLTVKYGADMTKEKTQLDRFKEAARELGTDDDEANFNAKLKKLAKKSGEKKDDK